MLKSWKKIILKNCKIADISIDEDKVNNLQSIDEPIHFGWGIDKDERFIKICKEELENQCYQGAEAFVHNLNTLSSRAGSQVPFSSVNFGLDTTPEGRLVSISLLNAQMSGLGRHETPIFPILIFTLKKGINFEKDDPNYDIFRLAMECSSKRLFPTYSFVDSSFNLPYYERDPYYGAIQTINKTCGFKTHLNGESPYGITYRAKLHLERLYI